MCALSPIGHRGWMGGGCAVMTCSCPHTPHDVMTSVALKVTKCPFLYHFHAFVSVVVSVEYSFSFLDQVKSCSSFLTQLKCCSFEKPLLVQGAALNLTLWDSIGYAFCLCHCSERLEQGIALPCLCIYLCLVTVPLVGMLF